jgi:hypothetical protein
LLPLGFGSLILINEPQVLEPASADVHRLR